MHTFILDQIQVRVYQAGDWNFLHRGGQIHINISRVWGLFLFSRRSRSFQMSHWHVQFPYPRYMGAEMSLVPCPPTSLRCWCIPSSCHLGPCVENSDRTFGFNTMHFIIQYIHVHFVYWLSTHIIHKGDNEVKSSNTVTYECCILILCKWNPIFSTLLHSWQ